MSDRRETVLVAVGGDSPDQWLPEFAQAFPEGDAVWLPDAAPEQIAAADWAIVWSPEASLLDRLKGVRALFSLGAGVDHLMGAKNLPEGAPIVRYVGRDLTHRMSEWVVLQCLLHLRLFRTYERQQSARQWLRPHQPGAEEVTVGLMGLGVLGQDAAKKLATIGFRLRGWSRTEKALDGVDCFHGPEQYDAFLAETDILVSLLPHTPATERLVTLDVLKRLRRDGALGGAFYVNGGRGKTQIDADIDMALRNGLLAGASLDVFETEPLPRDHPLWTAPNVFITPHAAAWSPRSDVVRYVVRQIRRHRLGEPFENVVDPVLGY
ncbi:MAG: glyoxylate/hydroxypyruvate reductase A [Phyllobacteriaceae bacterium]|nr:glyoxylate/hydroxypyruvate reductase A [Phyllobacteriaceae bacterium]